MAVKKAVVGLYTSLTVLCLVLFKNINKNNTYCFTQNIVKAMEDEGNEEKDSSLAKEIGKINSEDYSANNKETTKAFTEKPYLSKLFKEKLVEPTTELTGLKKSELLSKSDMKYVYEGIVSFRNGVENTELFDKTKQCELDLSLKTLNIILKEVETININSNTSAISQYIEKYNSMLGILQKGRDKLIDSEIDDILKINGETVSLIENLKFVHCSLYCYLRYASVKCQYNCMFYNRSLIDYLTKAVNYSRSCVLMLETIIKAIDEKFFINKLQLQRCANNFFSELVEPTTWSTGLKVEELTSKYKIFECCSDFKHQLDIVEFENNDIKYKIIEDIDFISELDTEDESSLLKDYKENYNKTLGILKKSATELSDTEKCSIYNIYINTHNMLQRLTYFYFCMESDIEKVGVSIFGFSKPHHRWVQSCKMFKSYLMGWCLTLKKIRDVIAYKFNFVEECKGGDCDPLKGEVCSKENFLVDGIKCIEIGDAKTNICDETKDKSSNLKGEIDCIKSEDVGGKTNSCFEIKNEEDVVEDSVDFNKNIVKEDNYYDYYHCYIDSKEDVFNIVEPYESNKDDSVLKIVDCTVWGQPTDTINLNTFFNYDLSHLADILMRLGEEKWASAEDVCSVYNNYFKNVYELTGEYIKANPTKYDKFNKNCLESCRTIEQISNFEVEGKLPGNIVSHYKKEYSNMRNILEEKLPENINSYGNDKKEKIEHFYNLTIALKEVLYNFHKHLKEKCFDMLNCAGGLYSEINKVYDYLMGLRKALKVIAAVILHKFPFVENQEDGKRLISNLKLNLIKDSLTNNKFKVGVDEFELNFSPKNLCSNAEESSNSAYKEVARLGESSKEAYKTFEEDFEYLIDLLNSDFKNCCVYVERDYGIFKKFAEEIIGGHIGKVKNYIASNVELSKDVNNKYQDMFTCYKAYVESFGMSKDFVLNILPLASNVAVDVFRENFKDMLEMKNFKESLAIEEKMGNLVKTTAEKLISGRGNSYGCNFFEPKNMQEFFSDIINGECVGEKDEYGRFSTVNSFSYGYKLKKNMINMLDYINSGRLKEYLEVTHFSKLKNEPLESFNSKVNNLKCFPCLKGLLANRIKIINTKLCDMFYKCVIVNISQILRMCVVELNKCLKFGFNNNVEWLTIPLTPSRRLLMQEKIKEKTRVVGKKFFNINNLDLYYENYEGLANKLSTGFDMLWYDLYGCVNCYDAAGKKITVDNYIYNFVLPLLDYLCILDSDGLKELVDMLACQFKFMLYSSSSFLNRNGILFKLYSFVQNSRDILKNSFNRLKEKCAKFEDVPENELTIYQNIGQNFLCKLVESMVNICDEYIKVYNKTPDAILQSEWNINSGLRDHLCDGLNYFVKNATSNLKIKNCKIEDLLLKDGVLFGFRFFVCTQPSVNKFLNSILEFVNVYLGNFERCLKY